MTKKILDSFRNDYRDRNNSEEMSLLDYLELCKDDPTVYASPAERILAAIGEPEVINTAKDPILSKIFSNRIIRRYMTFSEFYGMEEVIEKIVGYFKHSAQGLEESKQILYLLGPVGSAKSSIAERLKELMESIPVYVLSDSPIFESPLGLFKHKNYLQMLEKEYNIPVHSVRTFCSSYMTEKLKEVKGDFSKIMVKKIYPSILEQKCIAKVEPGDENNQDISTLVGKVDIREMRHQSQEHPYAYSWSGGLCRANRGILDFTEMFKAPIKMLNPLLEATQSRSYKGTESAPSIPFDGIIVAHSNESEWIEFRNNKTNEAFLDRINLVKIPYTLRVSEETKIYEKLLRESTLGYAPTAPGTLNMLAEFCILTRLFEPKNSTLYSKMRVYNGENIKETDPKAKPLDEYRDVAGVTEGMSGISTRFAFKILSKVFNHGEEISANPVHLMMILQEAIIDEQFKKETEDYYISLIKDILGSKYCEFVEKELRKAFLESYKDYGQTIFNRYIQIADAWMSDVDYRDRNTGLLLDRSALNDELEKIEKPAGISNPKDFRNDVVGYTFRYRAEHEGNAPRWDSFEKIRVVIEAKMFAATEDILPVISFTSKSTKEDQSKHDDFVQRMEDMGYTPSMTQLIVEWWQQYRRHN